MVIGKEVEKTGRGVKKDELTMIKMSKVTDDLNDVDGDRKGSEEDRKRSE